MPFLLCGLSFLYMRLEDAILVTVHIKNEADYVYGYEKTWIYRASGRRHLRNPVHT